MRSLIVLGLVLTLLIAVVSPAMAEGGSWGVGMGIPYGLMGMNVDLDIIQI